MVQTVSSILISSLSDVDLWNHRETLFYGAAQI